MKLSAKYKRFNADFMDRQENK